MNLLTDSDYKKLKTSLLEVDAPSLAISFLNPYSYYEIIESIEYSAIDGCFIDGMLLCRLLNLSRHNKIRRISFDYSSIAEDFLLHLEANALTFGFIGATDIEAASFRKHLALKYPRLNVVFYRNGYFDSTENILNYLESMPKVDVLLVGMGAPLQEKICLISKNFNKAKLAITCGGFISQTALRADYYLPIVKKLHLRWLQRIIMHKHVRKKVLQRYPSFIIKWCMKEISIFLGKYYK